MKKDKNTKQQRVRVLLTGELGTVTDQVLMKRGNKPMVYKQVRLDSKPHLDRWYWADELGETREMCRVTFENEDGQTLIFELMQDYDKGKMSINLSGRPDNLKEHRGLHALMAKYFVDVITQDEHR